MPGFARFLRILRTSCFAIIVALFSLNIASAAYDDTSCVGSNDGVPSPTEAVSGLLTWNELVAQGIITGSGSSWAPDQSKIDDYLRGQEWGVTFDTGTVTGYAGCTATGWKTSQSYSAISSANSGCACSLNKQTWWFIQDLKGGLSDRAAKTEYCRANCPALCASRVATNASFRAKLFGDSCPVVSSSVIDEPITEICDVNNPYSGGMVSDLYIMRLPNDVKCLWADFAGDKTTVSAEDQIISCIYAQDEQPIHLGGPDQPFEAVDTHSNYYSVQEAIETAINEGQLNEYSNYKCYVGPTIADSPDYIQTFNIINHDASEVFAGIENITNAGIEISRDYNTEGEYCVDDSTTYRVFCFPTGENVDNITNKIETTLDNNRFYYPNCTAETSNINIDDSGEVISTNTAFILALRTADSEDFAGNPIVPVAYYNHFGFMIPIFYDNNEYVPSTVSEYINNILIDTGAFPIEEFPNTLNSCASDLLGEQTFQDVIDALYPDTPLKINDFTSEEIYNLYYCALGQQGYNPDMPLLTLIPISEANTEEMGCGVLTYVPACTCESVPGYSCDQSNSCSYSPITYTITYVSNGGTEYAQANYTVNSNTITLPTPTREHYDFGGWYDNDQFNGNAITQVPSGSYGNKTFYAKWTLITYTIAYDNNGGSGCANETFTNTAVVCSNPTRNGYTFDGWATTNNGEIEYIGGETITQTNLTLYARWTPITYTITYVSNGGPEYSQANYTVNSNTITLPTPTREHYDFGGWYDNDQFDGDAITQVSSGSYGNKTFYALWILSSCENGYTLVGANPLNNKDTSTDGDDYGFNNDSSGAFGHDYVGIDTYNLGEQMWAVEFGYGTIRGNASCNNIAGNNNYEEWDNASSNWTAAYNTMSRSDTGSQCWCQLLDFTDSQTNNVYNANHAPWVYYSLVETQTNQDCAHDCAFFCSAAIEDDYKFRNAMFHLNSVASCEIENYTITYVSNGGTQYANDSYNINSNTITLPTPTREHYDFGGWYDNDQFNGNAITQIASGSYGNKTFYAQWTPTVYTIAYDNNGGSGCLNEEYTASATICVPTRSGYQFDGWIDINTTEIYEGGENVQYTNLNLEAQWSQLYTIAYVLSGGSGCENTTFTNTAVVCSDPTRNGFTFDGWSTTDGGDMEYIGDEVITKTDLTLYARWEPITYTITYVSNGGTEYANTSYNITSSTITLPTPTREHYDFVGWCDDEELTENCATNRAIPSGSTGNKTFYAQWTPNEQVLTYTFYCDSNYAIDLTSGQNFISDGLTFPGTSTCPQADSYTLGGWTCVNLNDSSETITFNDIQNAEWTADFYEFECFPNWIDPEEPIEIGIWECVDGVVESNANEWTNEAKTGLTTSQSLSDSGVVAPAGSNSYVLSGTSPEAQETNLNIYLTGEEFFVTWGETTIQGWAGCGPNTWNTKNEYNYTLKTLSNTNSGCGCSLDKVNFAVKKNLLLVSGSSWEEKNQYCRENCPAACAEAVANDQQFRNTLFNGTCPEAHVPEITCAPGYYLPGGSTTCSKCTNSGTYCEGDTFTPTDEDQGVKECPEIVNWPGAAEVEADNISRGSSDLRNSINKCSASFKFSAVPENISPGASFDPAYNSNSEYNVGVFFQQNSCFYNEESESYTDCLPSGVLHVNPAIVCLNGYKIKDSVAYGWPEITVDNITDEEWNSIKEYTDSHIGQLTNSCEKGQPGYYTKIYDTYKNAEYEQTRSLADKVGVALMVGKFIDMLYYGEGGEYAQSGRIVALSELYDNCPIEYPNSTAGSWQKAHCYANVTYVFNDGTENITNQIHYTDAAQDGYVLELPTPTLDNYVFTGWYTNENLTGTPITNETVLAGDATLYGKWTPATYTITYVSNGGTEYEPVNYNVTSTTITLPIPTRDNYVFDGWCDDEELTINCSINRKVQSGSTGNKTFYAKWELAEFVCESGVWLNIGDDTRACLSATKVTSPALAVQIGNNKYYLQITEDTDKHINEDTNTKMHIYYNNREYNVHDASITQN